MIHLRLLLLFLCAACNLLPQRLVKFPIAGKQIEIEGDLYGAGHHGLVLAHGGRFGKESWKKQAGVLASSGFLVLAVRFRGDGLNPDGSPGSFGNDEDNAEDIKAAAAYLRRIGAKDVSAIGGSLGGDAVGLAAGTGIFSRVVFLGSNGGYAPEKLSGEKLFIVARNDSNGAGPRLPDIMQHYEKAPNPKKIVIVEGSAHAQFLFESDQGPRVMAEIRRFLSTGSGEKH